MTIPTRTPRTTIERHAARTAERIRRELGETLRTMREDGGVILGRVAAALGGTLSLRVFPGTGPLIRDHIQAAMITALLGQPHPTWRPTLEVSVHRPVRGVTDLVLEAHEPHPIGPVSRTRRL